MHLDSTTRKIQAKLSGAPAANQCPIVVGWTDATTTTVAGGAAVVNTNSATAVDCVPAPAAATVRKVNTLTCYNADTAQITVTFLYNDNGTTYVIDDFTLQPGETVQYTDREGWNIVAAPATGRLIRSVQINVGTTTYTPSAGCRRIRLRMIAGGGAGGGGATAAASAGVGGGGAAGGYAEKTFQVTPGTVYACAVGAGGTPGAAGNNPGGDGSNTTFTVAGVTVTCFGGPGGTSMAAAGTVAVAAGGTSPAASTGGDINASGAPGGFAARLSSTVACSGVGGSATFGAGGAARQTQGAGLAPVGNGGGGGGGACINAGGNVAGGAGGDGCIIVHEFT